MWTLLVSYPQALWHIYQTNACVDNIPALPNRAALGTNETFRAAATELWNTDRTGPYSSFVSHGGFLHLCVISNRTESLVETLLAQDSATFFPAGTDPTVIAGYETRRNTSAQQILGTKSAIFEVPFDGEPSFSLILLKQQSRGTIFLSPDDGSTARGDVEPIINFRTFTHPIHIQFCIEILRFWREFHLTPLMQQTFNPVEITAGPDIVTDEDITEWLRRNMFSSEGHLTGTAALGPRELGGCWDLIWRFMGRLGWVLQIILLCRWSRGRILVQRLMRLGRRRVWWYWVGILSFCVAEQLVCAIEVIFVVFCCQFGSSTWEFHQ